MRPIPKALLPDSIEVQCPAEGKYGGVFEEPREITNVRFDAATNLTRSSYVFDSGSKGLIYIDRVNSAGSFAIPVGSLITLNGEEMMAVKVTPYKAFHGVIHHWEVEVA